MNTPTRVAIQCKHRCYCVRLGDANNLSIHTQLLATDPTTSGNNNYLPLQNSELAVELPTIDIHTTQSVITPST